MNDRKKTEANRGPVPGSEGLKFAVKDFGPIASGKVHLRPLTVFAGPSNTGKSWLATLIYGTERYFERLGSAGEFARAMLEDDSADYSSSFPEHPDAWLESVRQNKPISLTNQDKGFIKLWMENRQRVLEEELLRCFGLFDPHHLVREGGAGVATISVEDRAASRSWATSHKLSIANELSLSVKIAKDLRLVISEDPQLKEVLLKEWERLASSRSPAEGNRQRVFSGRPVFSVPFLGPSYPELKSAYYLPADRGGIMQARDLVLKALVRSTSLRASRGDSLAPILAGVSSDFLEHLILPPNLDHQFGQWSESRSGAETDRSRKRAEALEKNILQGTVKVERSESGYRRFTYQPDRWDRSLPLINVSSMVSELAPVALFLRYLVRPGDLLILEEPEAHLHPAMQAQFTHEIAGWVKQGIRVLITTHSEWVLDALANVVAEGETNKETGLSSQEVGVWLFKASPSGKGSRIKEIPWATEEGGFETGFDSVAVDLHNHWAGLMEKGGFLELTE